MQYTVGELAEALGLEAVGDAGFIISGLSEPGQAKADDLALASTPKYAEALANGAAQAALLWADADWQALGLKAAILPARPRYALSRLTNMMDEGQGFIPGIHPSAIIDPSARIGADVSIGPGAVIGPEAQIWDGSVIGPLCYIGWRAVIGRLAYLREHVSIGAKVRIGERFHAHPGVRIGGDGFSFVTPEKSGAETVRETLGAAGHTKDQHWSRIASLGGIEIGDDVEIGSNSLIDNGTIRATRVGNRTKIDGLCHLGHNVVVGNDNLICGQVGIAGSATVGDFVVIAGQAGVADNITVGDRVVITGGTKIMSSVRPGKVMMGYPGIEMKSHMESYKALRRLPRFLRDVSELKKAFSNGRTGD